MTYIYQFEKPLKNIDSSITPGYLPKSRIVIFLMTVFLIILILSGNYLFLSDIKVDSIANQNYYATTTFEYIDKDATQKLIDKTINQITPVLIKDNKLTSDLYEDLEDLLQNILDIKEVIKNQPYFNTSIISTKTQNYLYKLTNDAWQDKIYKPAINILAQILVMDLPEKIDKDYMSTLIDKKLINETDIYKKKAIKHIILASFFPTKEINAAIKTTDNPVTRIKKEDILELINNHNKNITQALRKNNIDKETSKINSVITANAYIFYSLESIRNKRRINSLILNNLPAKMNALIPDISEQKLHRIDEFTTNVFTELLNKGISETDLKNLDTITDKYLTNEFLPQEKELIHLIIKQVARANMVYDQKEMEKLKNEAIKHVIPIYIRVHSGSTLVRMGEKITPEKLYILNKAGLLNKEINWFAIYEIFITVLIAVSSFLLLMYFINKESLNSISTLCFISILTIFTLLMTYFLHNNYPKFIPLVVSTGLLVIFINRRTALLHLFIMSLLIYQSFYIYFPNLISLVIGSIFAACLPQRITQRIVVIKYGVIIGLVQVITYNLSTVCMDIINNNSFIGFNYQIIIESIYCLVSGLLASMIILTLQPVVEEVFGLISFSKLNELGDFSQPLLRQLEEKAPGTFQHSIAVSTLSEYAARKLHLDSTCCRIGSYYHDIGKLFKPEFFVENQQGGINPHDLMDDPYKSAKIIISHARAGLVLARNNKLPPLIQSYIIEHHGTSLVAYFLYQAKKKLKENEQIDENFFRYYGPRPQSKETAIVMLADASEAAVRALKEKNRTSVKEKIQNIVAEKINDGQLSESHLNADDIAIIIDAFTTVVLELHHQRIEYPSAKKSA